MRGGRRRYRVPDRRQHDRKVAVTVQLTYNVKKQTAGSCGPYETAFWEEQFFFFSNSVHTFFWPTAYGYRSGPTLTRKTVKRAGFEWNGTERWKGEPSTDATRTTTARRTPGMGGDDPRTPHDEAARRSATFASVRTVRRLRHNCRWRGRPASPHEVIVAGPCARMHRNPTDGFSLAPPRAGGFFGSHGRDGGPYEKKKRTTIITVRFFYFFFWGGQLIKQTHDGSVRFSPDDSRLADSWHERKLFFKFFFPFYTCLS